MKILEKQGKSVEGAIEQALTELNASRDEVEVEVLEEGNRGILGFLSKSARVRVTLKPRPEEVGMKFLKNVISKFDVDVKINGSFEKNILNIEMECDDAGIIIGKHGSTLDALQYLTSLVVNRNSEDFIRVMLDAENYREKREKTLERLAKRVARKAMDNRKSVSLEPMNPNERRIIHTALQQDSRVMTKSVGEEPNRRVVISPNK